MTTTKRAINRISISELPSATSIDNTDYLILQSDGVSSKIQVADIQFSRENIAFYNEIAALNISSSLHQDELKLLRSDIGTLQEATGISSSSDQSSESTTSDKITAVESTTAQLRADTTIISKSVSDLTERVTSSEEAITTNHSDVMVTLGEISSSLADINVRLLDVEEVLRDPHQPGEPGTPLSHKKSMVSVIEAAVKKILSATSNGISENEKISFDWTTGT